MERPGYISLGVWGVLSSPTAGRSHSSPWTEQNPQWAQKFCWWSRAVSSSSPVGVRLWGRCRIRFLPRDTRIWPHREPNTGSCSDRRSRMRLLGQDRHDQQSEASGPVDDLVDFGFPITLRVLWTQRGRGADPLGGEPAVWWEVIGEERILLQVSEEKVPVSFY